MSARRNVDMRNVQMRLFRCEVCGAVAPASKRKGKTNPGHLKHMFCVVCGRQTEHIQIE